MPASPRTVTGPYRVNFAPEAWKQIGRIPSSAFASLQEALERIASEMGTERPPQEGAHFELQFEVQGLRVIYQRDDETRTLTLLDISPVAPHPK